MSMKVKILNKADINTLIDAVTDSGDIFHGPVRNESVIEFTSLKNGNDMVFDYTNTKLPFKRYFFPASEVLFSSTNAGNGSGIVNTPDTNETSQKNVFFGVRPCDAYSLALLDKVFLGDPHKDPYYLQKRENSLIISLACEQEGETCFCTAVNGSLVNEKGSDILCYRIDDTLLFKSITPKGEEFLDSCAHIFTEPDQAVLEAQKEFETRAVGKEKAFSLGQTETTLGSISPSDPFWEEVSRFCLTCGICTYLCPTCHCFGLHDENRQTYTDRIRVQDSCMYGAFSMEASGHNPRAGKNLRMRQRVMHKFSYAVTNTGDVYCVGCGRCIDHCPVNIDIRETIVKAGS
jgi:sulfhydrogenase subunit beta (sulfur reductase)